MRFKLLLARGEHRAQPCQKDNKQATSRRLMTNPRARHGKDSIAAGVRERNQRQRVILPWPNPCADPPDFLGTPFS